jgi:uncharacterized protein (TIGR02099 family)
MFIRGSLRAVVGVVLTLWSVLLLGWLTFHWGILPHIDDWRARIEAHASAAMGLPVHIGRIEVRSSGWVPAFELHDVTLSDRQGREALRLPRVAAAIAPQSLLALQLRFAQLYVEGAELVVRRDRDGHWHVGGLDLSEGAALEGSAAGDWFFQQHELVIQGGSLLWQDELHAAAPLQLQQVQLVVRNSLRTHDLRLDATPPEAWGERFSLRGRFRQPLLARAGDWQRWTGTAYAELPRAQAELLRQHLALPVDLRSGSGRLRAWADLRMGQWQQATLDLALAEVDLHLVTGGDNLAFARLQGRFTAERPANGLRLKVEGLQFQTPDGLSWPASQAALSWQFPVQAAGWLGPTDRQAIGGSFSADRLDLATLATLAERLPLPAAWRRQLADLTPQGRVQGLEARWTGPADQPSHYRVQARLDDLSIAALPSPEADGVGRPGWRHANLKLDANETGGQAQLSLQDGALVLPGVFADPVLPLRQFSSHLIWHIRPGKPAAAGADAPPPAIEVLLQDGRFANADTQGDFQLRWQTGAGPLGSLGKGARFPGLLDLNGRLQKAQAGAVARYLPLGLAASARDYVAHAVRDGQVSHASFKVRGDLWDFPFARSRDGEFHVAAQVEGVTLAYVPERPGSEVAWPPFTQVQGELVFDRGAMEIHHAKAHLWGIELQGVNGKIPNLLEHAALQISGSGRGPLTDALKFVAASPVGGWTRNALHEARATGDADLKLDLHIPLDDADRSTVRGTVTLAGNEVRLRPDVPVLGNAKARIDFTQRGFSIIGGSARALGGDVSIDGGSLPDGSVRVTAQGVATAEALRRSPELGSLARWAGALNGQSPYRLQLGFARGQTEFNLSSPLTGMALDLPAPLRKSAAESWPLKVQTTLQGEAATPATRDLLHLELGHVLQADFQRELGTDSPRVLRGALAVGEASLPALPAAGVLASARLGSITLDPWLATLRRLQIDTAGAAHGAAASYLPQEWQLKAQSLGFEGRQLSQLSASLQRRPGADGNDSWHASLSAEQAQGQVDYRPGNPAKLSARLARLAIPAGHGGTVEPAPAAADSGKPGPLPALDIVVDALEWHGHPLGRLELEAPGATDDAREWRLNRLSLVNPDARLSGSGLWSAQPRRRMALDLQLDLADSGALLERMGMGKVMRGGKGQVKGQLAWQGGPFAPELAQLSGGVQLSVDNGQFLKVEPGAARLLGILSLQSLPRRLTLDFRDVFQQGFAFDNLGGDISLAGPIARTSNLRIRGVQAAVLFEGQTDLQRETQDLHMVVVPELNAGTASLAYAAINPAVGLGTFLAQFLLRGTLQQAGTREFRISGSWDKPSMDAIETAPPAGRSATEGPSAAASTSERTAR